MNRNKEIIGALALDLKRVASGYHCGSTQVAERFSEETLKRKEEVELHSVKPYLQNLLEKLPEVLKQRDKESVAEDSLMYSILFQNYALKNL